MSDKRKRLIRDFVNNRADDIERETGRPATSDELKAAHDEADSRADTYLKGWTGRK